MPLTLERVAKITAKGQTTVPKAVRDALGVGEGDSIAFRLDDQGGVTLARHEAEDEESAVDAFLAFIAADIRRRPEAVTQLSEATADRRRSLAAGVKADPDGDYSGAGII